MIVIETLSPFMGGSLMNSVERDFLSNIIDRIVFVLFLLAYRCGDLRASEELSGCPFPRLSTASASTSSSAPSSSNVVSSSSLFVSPLYMNCSSLLQLPILVRYLPPLVLHLIDHLLVRPFEWIYDRGNFHHIQLQEQI